MARGFMRGMLFGSLLGAVVAAFTVPQFKPFVRVSRNVKKIYKDVRGGMKDMTE